MGMVRIDAQLHPDETPSSGARSSGPRRLVEVDAAIAVLANDPEFHRRVADRIALGAGRRPWSG